MSQDSYDQCDHLFLLIGANPLPNYVAVQMLLKKNGCVHFIASSDDGVAGSTQRIVHRLKETLQKYQKNIVEQIHEVPPLKDPSSEYEIRTELTAYLDQLQANRNLQTNQVIGLNYTGGTKPMSVHAYATIQTWCQKPGQRHRFITSYLDPRLTALRFAGEQQKLIRPEDIHMTLPELFTLHGWQHTKEQWESLQQVTLPLLTQNLVETLHKTDALTDYRQWCNRNLRGEIKNSEWVDDWEAFVESGQALELSAWVQQPGHEQQLKAFFTWMQSKYPKKKKS